jgi:hypothetical protein
MRIQGGNSENINNDKNNKKSDFGLFLVDVDGAREHYGFGAGRSRSR